MENKETMNFERNYGGDECPKCGSPNIEYTGSIADGELATWKCHDCGHYWETIR